MVVEAKPFVPWSVEGGVPPVVPSCTGCGEPFVDSRPPHAGRPLLGWKRDRKDGLETATCPGCDRRWRQAALGPELTHTDHRRIAASRELSAIERAWCERNPWYTFVNYVVTEDSRWVQKGLSGPYHKFPPLAYLRSSVYVLWRYVKVTAWPKSRQMVITWLVASYMLLEAQFLGGRLYMIQSKKEKDSQAVLARVMGVHTRLAQFAPYLVSPLTKDDVGHVAFANGSQIMATAQGAHHVQSYTPAWLYLDEIQLQDEAEEAYHQGLPACERQTLVGSADFGWFWQTFLTDELNA